MTIVHRDSVSVEDLLQPIDDAISGSFDSKGILDNLEVVNGEVLPLNLVHEFCYYVKVESLDKQAVVLFRGIWRQDDAVRDIRMFSDEGAICTSCDNILE